MGGGAPTDATYITQTPNATLTNEQALSTLATGLMKNTTGSGVITIATAGTDYVAPGSVGSDLATPSTFVIKEEFGATSSTAVLELNWSACTVVSGGLSSTSLAGTWPHIGVSQYYTNSTSGSGGAWFMGSCSGSRRMFGDPASNGPWTLTWIFNVEATADERFRIGTGSRADQAVPTDGFYLRYDTSLGDSNFLFAVVASGSENTYGILAR